MWKTHSNICKHGKLADYWKSQGRKFCDFCKCWIADNKPSIDFHEGGKKHKENVSKRLKEIHKNSAKQAKQNKKFEDDLKKMENAAMAAYLKDVENNTRDMTADRIIKEKLNRSESLKAPQNANSMPEAAPETVPRFKQNNYRHFPQEIDPCDPTALTRLSHTKNQQSTSVENKTQGKNKTSKGKGKKKKAQEDDGRRKAVRKLWYEALSPEGYTYYWHIETNESVWEPPEEGYMTFAEQEEEVKEQALQEELLEQLKKEEEIEKADLIEEQRANAERERMKELRKQQQRKQEVQIKEEDSKEIIVKQESKEEEEKPYRRDYSIPEFQQPYGSWETVKVIERKPVDLQLPQQKQIQLPIFEKSEPPPPQRIFKEKTITTISTGDSDDEGSSLRIFKKRKIGNKNVRKRLEDD
ncbi:WW domain-binding protein 4 isoform X1 [Vespa velutina]|uniref:WW domain-binding protein 4 isoform X1 n=2 Tax=Vespa velutina TaxID=202808 RepID=UPI001FB24188|nr:WW domain-binding protein 4 isoform X1 [Vespa velutina]